MQKTKIYSLSALLVAFCLANTGQLDFSKSKLAEQLHIDNAAYARSSGGRSGGGSFRSSPSRSNSSSPSRSSTTTPSRSNSSNTYRSTPRPNRYIEPQRGGNTIVAPVIINGGGSGSNRSNYNTPNNTNSSSANESDDGLWILLVVLLIFVGVGIFIYFIFRMINSSTGTSSTGGGNDLDNETVTVSKLQVAMLAEAREVQARLSEISIDTDTDTHEGLLFLMQESGLALLRTPENWTHVLASSQAIHRDQAENIFNRLSLEERSKFSAETLANVRGKVRREQPVVASSDEDPAAYIVVTLLIGTEHDKPLFGEIKSSEALTKALQDIVAIPDSHLLIFELLWSPQAETDSLTYDELLTEYSGLVQI